MNIQSRIDVACTSFRDALNAGEHPDPDDYLREFQGDEREAAKSELREEYDDYKRCIFFEPPTSGKLWGKFFIECEIASGGMGKVYRSKDNLGRVVALKVIHPELLPWDDGLRYQSRLIAEASHAAILDGLDGFPSVYEAGWNGVHAYFTQQLVRGQTLKALTAQNRYPEPKVFLRVFACILDIVSAVHHRGVCHGDLSPSNIMLTDEDQVRVIDFGLSRLHLVKVEDSPRDDLTRDLTLTADGTHATIYGTPGFAAPEQTRVTGRATPQGDVYSLGCLLFFLFTRERPFAETDNPLQVLQRSRAEAIPWRETIKVPAFSERIRGVAEQATEIEPEKRFADAGEFLTAFRHAKDLDEQEREQERQQLREKITKFETRPKVQLAYGFGQMVAALGGLIGAILALSLHYGSFATITESVRSAFSLPGGRWIIPSHVLAPLFGGFLGGLLSIQRHQWTIGKSGGLLARRWLLNAALGWFGAFVGTLGGLVIEDALPPIKYILFVYSIPALLAFAVTFFATSLKSDATMEAPLVGSVLLGLLAGGIVLFWKHPDSAFVALLLPTFAPIFVALFLHIIALRGWLEEWPASSTFSQRRGDWIFCVVILVSTVAGWSLYFMDHRRFAEPGHGFRDAVFVAGGAGIIAVSEQGELSLVNCSNKTLLPGFGKVSDSVSQIAVSPDGRYLAAVGGFVPGAKGGPIQKSFVKIFDLNSWDADGWTVQTLESPVCSIAFSPDSQHFAIGTHGSIEIWTVPTRELASKRVEFHLCPGRAQHLAWATTGLVVGDSTNVVLVFKPFQTHKAQILSGHSQAVIRVAVAPDGTKIASASTDGTVRIWDPHTKQELLQIAVGSAVWGLDWSSDGRRLVSTTNQSIRLWEATSGRELTWYCRDWIGGIQGACFSPDGKHLVSWGEDVPLRLWSLFD